MSKPAVEGNVRQVIQDLQRRVAELERRDSTVNRLSELSNDIGDVTFGDGVGGLNADGITLNIPTTYTDKNSYRFIYNGATHSGLYSQFSAGYGNLFRILASAITNEDSQIDIYSKSPSGKASYINLYASVNNVVDDGTINIVNNNGTSNIALQADTVTINATGGIKTSNSSLSFNNANDDTNFIFNGTSGAVLTVNAGDNDVDIATKMNFGNVGVLTGGTVTLANNEATSFTPTTSRGVLILRGAGAQNTEYAMITYAAIAGTAYAYSWVNGTNTEITTGALAGTTGTDVKVTISAHTDGKIYIENRRGGSRSFAWQIVAGV